MTPLERLLAEGVPDGTFGGARPTPKERRRVAVAVPGPDPLAAEHCRELLAALAEKPRPVRHLHAVPPPPSVAA